MDIFFQINLSSYARNNVLLHINHHTKIHEVKSRLRDTLSLSEHHPIQLSIMGMGKVLSDGLTVSDYNLHNGSIITVKIYIRVSTDKVESPKDNQTNTTTTNTNSNTSNNTNNDNIIPVTFYDKIGFFPTQSKNRIIPKYYNYTKVITIIEFWCRSLGIHAIETELLDFIAIYTSYIHSKILCIAEDELRSCYFEVYVQLKGFNEYFEDKNHDIKRVWLDQYIELKMIALDQNERRRRQSALNSVNYSHNYAFSNASITLKCDDLKESEFDENRNEMFVLCAHMPSELEKVYKVKGELNDIVCWVEFGFMKKQNVKVFGLRSNMFVFTYQGMNVENNTNGLDQKIMRNRQLLIDIEIVKVLKRDALYEAISKLQLVQRVQKRLKHRFWPQDLLVKQRISSLASDGYCIVVGEQLLYLDGPHTMLRGNEEDF